MNSTSTGELTPDEVALKKFENAPRKESASTYHYTNGSNGTPPPETKDKAEQAKTRREQVLQDLETYTLPSEAFMNTASGRWHIKDYFYAGQVGVMVGLWKAGKTFSAIHLSFRIAWGLPLMQPKTEANTNAKPVGEVRLKGNVLYIPAEGAGGLKDRIKAYRQYYNQHMPADACDVLVFPKPFDVFNEGCLLALADYCTKKRIVFIVIDTLASNLAGLIRNRAHAYLSLHKSCLAKLGSGKRPHEKRERDYEYQGKAHHDQHFGRRLPVQVASCRRRRLNCCLATRETHTTNSSFRSIINVSPQARAGFQVDALSI